MPRFPGRYLLAALAAAWTFAPGAVAQLSTQNITPFPRSQLIVGADWTSPRYGPPRNQSGDILPTVWADDGAQYTLIDDGGADVPEAGGLWRQSLAQITGVPPRIQIRHVGNPFAPPPATYRQIAKNKSLWTGPIGPYYSSGLLAADHVLYATQQNNWNWNANGPFTGLAGIAYSADLGQHWVSGSKPFPPPLGNLSWVIRGRGGHFEDGWVYAIASEREFNASTMLLGRSRPDISEMTDPAQWQWLSGWSAQNTPIFSSSLSSAVPVISWSSRITYPQMAYDSPIHRYLLAFTFSYGATPPAIWRNGSDLVILEAQHPWGPFSFVAHESFFGPSNGYAAGFPLGWISRNGRDLWVKFAANFDGCAANLNCWAAYGFNYRRLHLVLAPHTT